MSQTGRFFGQLESIFGKGMVTSGYRSQAEQDALVQRGVTKATHSSHTYEDGYDLAIPAGRNEQEIRAKLASQGLTAGKIIRESGRGSNQGTGAHWHIELGGSRQVAGNSGQAPAASSNPQDFLAGLGSRLGPEGRASSAVDQNADPIFNSQPELDSRAAKVEGVLTQQGDAIKTLTGLQDALHHTQTTAMEQQVNETRAISNQITTATSELANQVAPVFQARARIADQLDRINTMNPLERGLRGMFDLNYDRSYLENQLQHYDTTLEMRAHDFDYVNKLHASALNEIERRYSLDTALPKLAVDQVTEDLGTLGLSLQQTSGMLGALKDRIGTQSQMIAAQAAARNDMMGQLDMPTLTDLAGKARAAGGIIDFNGTKLNYHELREMIQKREQQDLSLESMRMSIAGGRMDLAQKQAENTIQYMTRAEVEGAIAAGGMFKGVQLPADKLTQALAIYTQQGNLAANSIAQQLPATQVFNMATQAFNTMTQLTQRARGILGADGLGDITHISGDANQLMQKLTTAVQTNQAPEVINELLQQIGKKQAALSQQIGDRLLRHVGGDKRAAGYLQSFVSGTPMSQGTAAEALTYFALKGALPQGMGLSDEAKQLFTKAQGLVGKFKNQVNPATKKPYTEKDLQAVVTRELASTAGATIGAARSDRLMNDLPTLAQKAGHPLGKLGITQFRNARAMATQQAATTIAHQLKTTPDVVLKMVQRMGPVDDSQQAQDLFKAFKAQAGAFNAAETSNFIQNLDDLPQVTPGRRNSSVVLDFLDSPTMHVIASNYSDYVGQRSMGDYIVNPIATGATEMGLNQSRSLIRNTQSAVYADAKANARRQSAALANDPLTRVDVILRSIPGIGKEGSAALRPVVTQILTQAERETQGQGGGNWSALHQTNSEFANTAMQRQESFVINGLRSTKFDDPKLETYRKLAIKGWDDHSTQANTFLQNMLDALNPLN